MEKRIHYDEGDIFCVPLYSQRINRGYVLGVVARKGNRISGRVFLGYFFSGLYVTPPRVNDVLLRPSEAIKIVRVFHNPLREGRWPIIGKVSSWTRAQWPLPLFLKRDLLCEGVARSIAYSEDDISRVVAQAPEPWESMLETDGIADAGFIEDMMRNLLFHVDGTPKRN